MTAALGPAPDAPMDVVEWRPQGKAYDGRCQWVAYLDAAAVTALMDSWVGPTGWRDSYTPTSDGNMWCTVEVYAPDLEVWVHKTDVGTPSNMEAAKGLVSDAFKRAACLKWGVGRNVYELPIVWAACDLDQRGNPRQAAGTMRQILEECKKRGADVADSRLQDAPPDPEPADEGKLKHIENLRQQLLDAGHGGVASLADMLLYARKSNANADAAIQKLERRLENGVEEDAP